MGLSKSAVIASDLPAGSGLERRARAVLERGDWAVALGLVWIAMLAVQATSDNILGIDGYYHIKFAWLIREQGPRVDFPWLPLTILNPREFTDHHLLFHLLLVPFTLLADLRVGGSFYDGLRWGAKLAGFCFGVLAAFSTYLVMTRLRVRFPLVWLVVLLGSGEWFLARESMTRRQSISLALLMLAAYLIISGRWRRLLPLAFAYAWLFDGFVLLVGVVGLGFGARLMAERRPCWPILGWTALGLGLALVVNPYFPNNIRFTYLHILPKLLPEAGIRVGTEWQPYPPSVLVQTSWLALILLPLGFVPLVQAPGRLLRDSSALLLGSSACLFTLLYLRARRFIEIEPAFVVLFCAYAWTRFGPPLGVRRVWDRVPALTRTGLVAALMIGLSVQAVIAVREAQRDFRDNRPYTALRAAALWVEQNSAPGERVFQTDWDDFPQLFFYNTHNTYILGLDPTYLSLASPGLYALWREISRGQIEHPSDAIREQFQARWVITDRAHADFIGRARSDPDLELSLEDADALVFRVRS